MLSFFFIISMLYARKKKSQPKIKAEMLNGGKNDQEVVLYSGTLVLKKLKNLLPKNAILQAL